MARTVMLLLLAVAGSSGQTAGPPRFDVASVKPNAEGGADMQGLGTVRLLPGGRLSAEKAQLRYFIQNAYEVKPFQVLGGAGWINSAHYDIEAKADGNPGAAQMRLMMQALLEDRFQLKVHRETRELPVYELSVAKSGPTLPAPKEGSCIEPSGGPPSPPLPGQAAPCGRILMTFSPPEARLEGGRVNMPELIRILSNLLARTVVDKTGLAQSFDVRVEFAPDNSLGGLPSLPPAGAAGDAAGPSLFRALEEQLGLKLIAGRGPVEVILIDRVERPSGN